MRPILDRVGDSEKLLTLLDKAGDLNALTRLLDRVDGLEDLELYLLMAGGPAQAGRLLKQLQRAHALGDVRRAEDLLNLAGGNAASFEKLADALELFKLKSAPSGPQPKNLAPDYSIANIKHFLERHTYEFFDFDQIKGKQDFWPADTSADDVAGYLEEALDALRGQNPPKILGPWQSEIIDISIGKVQVGASGTPGQIKIGQFFPKDAFQLLKPEMEAIKRLLVP